MSLLVASASVQGSLLKGVVDVVLAPWSHAGGQRARGADGVTWLRVSLRAVPKNGKHRASDVCTRRVLIVWQMWLLVDRQRLDNSQRVTRCLVSEAACRSTSDTPRVIREVPDLLHHTEFLQPRVELCDGNFTTVSSTKKKSPRKSPGHQFPIGSRRRRCTACHHVQNNILAQCIFEHRAPLFSVACNASFFRFWCCCHVLNTSVWVDGC